uniref:Bromo domain-containing protein n=1 Tax=Musca domestica TaxID=7370 RepID=T1PIQ4_MUSDO
MDLETIGKNIEAHQYHSRTDFLADIELIAVNCEQYNGSESRFTQNAKHILEFARTQLEECSEQCLQLEQNIAKVQERARVDADLDDTWGGVEDQEYDYTRTSRSSTPENEFIDVEGNERPSSSSNATLQRGIGGLISLNTGSNVQNQDMQPPIDIKRGRGRPRKLRDVNEEVKFNANAVKRGRGRPRKDSLTSNLSNPHNSSFTEEDQQCSTEDEDDEFQEVSEDENSAANILDQGERMHSMSNAGGSEGEGSEALHSDNLKSEMKMEAPQLIGEESMDLDPNYDPSDFLTMHNRLGGGNTNAAATTDSSYQTSNVSQFLPQDEDAHQESAAPMNQDHMNINNDLAISESDDDDDNARPKKEGGFSHQMEQDIAGAENASGTHNMMGIQQQIQQLSSYGNVSGLDDHQQQEQPSEDPPSQDDNNDDDWLRF